MDELITWLRAQLDEDERDAPDIHERPCEVNTITGGECNCGWPNRVLAEVKAKRLILDEHQDVAGACAVCSRTTKRSVMRQDMPCLTVRLLAQPYAGRDGWREEWSA